MLPVRLPRLRVGALICATGLILLLMAVYQFELVEPSSRMGQMLGLQPIDLGPVDYTAALVYLIERRRMDDIPHSLGEAQRNIPWQRQWPIVLFHTGEYDAQDARDEFYTVIKENKWSRDVYFQLRNRIEFVKLEFQLPPGIPEDKSVYKPQVSEEKWPGKYLTSFA